MFLPLFVFCLPFIYVAFAYNPHRNNNTVWDYVNEFGSKDESEYDVIETTLNQPNITFFLPNQAAFATALGNGVLNFTNINTTISQIQRHIITHQIYTTDSLLHGHQYITPNDSSTAHLPLVVGPSLHNNSILQVTSGIITANVISNSIQCSNGIIHMIDQFLQQPKSTMDTIESLSQLETHELLMKSLNLTTVVSGPNKTIFAPISQAWADANSTSMPYGTLVHNLKYQVVDGVYLQQSLYDPSNPNSSIVLPTNRHDASLTFQMSNTGEMLVIGKSITDVAHIIRSDIITTEGVIHMVDKVLSADLKETSGSTTSISSDGSGSRSPGSSSYGGDNVAASPPKPDTLQPMPASGDTPSSMQPADSTLSFSSSPSHFDTITLLSALSPPLIALCLF
ncbi:hypothetical protein O0I10_009188 [Lichtheimia ornata]|uniref:FAS1 domain-containing protein n=1 Tax=Lichtheimia ornata TaxID=688661 RepID=A0AAD7UXX6_9FUNG|nr:uncharacterized protein O0I10_009188 [Lichtheimia ornata]KAJ8655153.1 hypothetical protein O0I10_009188 [Lichtheimia ornata]